MQCCDSHTPGQGPVWLQGVRCYDTEVSLIYCDNDGMDSQMCEHTEDVGIICDREKPEEYGKGINGSGVRLVVVVSGSSYCFW